ncbi:MAG: hypothetical protein ACXWRE_06530 [Pseudobdellovibrionaceae bacterium]
MNLKNNHGLTAFEVLVALGLASVAMGIIASTQLSVIKEQTLLRKTVEANIDETLAERILFKDLNGLDPSFNNLNVKDDNGQLFFDFYPDIPEKSLKAKKDRDFTLTPDGKKEFYVLAQDISAGSLLVYDPVMAYEVGPAPDDFNMAASLSFQSLNRNNWVGVQRPGFWIDNMVLMLDTPAKLRPVTGGIFDLQIPPRSSIFVGAVKGKNLNPLAGEFGHLLINTHPETGIVVDSADKFLRTLPSIGGGQSIVRLRAVKLIKYSLERIPLAKGNAAVSASANLYRSVYMNGVFSQKQLLADKVEKFVLHRDSVLKRMIYFKVYKTESL